MTETWSARVLVWPCILYICTLFIFSVLENVHRYAQSVVKLETLYSSCVSAAVIGQFYFQLIFT